MSIANKFKGVNFEERALTDVPAPDRKRLTRAEVFTNAKGMPNYEVLKTHFQKEGRVTNDVALEIINMATQLHKKEPNMLHLQDPITVCGDVHGQYYDLLKLFEIGGSAAQTQYLFLGDYVDRGCFSCEVTLLMYAIKINHPTTFFMLRGNHECRHLTSYFNFKQECLYKYNSETYDAFMTSFDCLPLAAILNNRFFCVHGGLSPDVMTLEDVTSLNRFREPPQSGSMCDLLWSDPMEEDEDGPPPDTQFAHNELRGCSYVYSYRAVTTFLRNNNLLSVIRAHEAQDEGYRLYRKCDATDFPSVICIFSAPNYCDVYNNKGAVIRFQNNLMNIRQFNYSPHPYYLPNFMNAFNWSLPFVAEKVTDMLWSILNVVSEEEDQESSDEEQSNAEVSERGEVIRKKIRTVGKLCRMFKTLREENENIVILKGLAGGLIPQGLLTQGPDALRDAVRDFQSAKELDAVNEKRPPVPRELEEEVPRT